MFNELPEKFLGTIESLFILLTVPLFMSRLQDYNTENGNQSQISRIWLAYQILEMYDWFLILDKIIFSPGYFFGILAWIQWYFMTLWEASVTRDAHIISMLRLDNFSNIHYSKKKFDRIRFPFYPELLPLPSFNRCLASTVCTRLIPFLAQSWCQMNKFSESQQIFYCFNLM
jgi:hypothetical protein